MWRATHQFPFLTGVDFSVVKAPSTCLKKHTLGAVCVTGAVRVQLKCKRGRGIAFGSSKLAACMSERRVFYSGNCRHVTQREHGSPIFSDVFELAYHVSLSVYKFDSVLSSAECLSKGGSCCEIRPFASCAVCHWARRFLASAYPVFALKQLNVRDSAAEQKVTHS